MIEFIAIIEFIIIIRIIIKYKIKKENLFHIIDTKNKIIIENNQIIKNNTDNLHTIQNINIKYIDKLHTVISTLIYINHEYINKVNTSSRIINRNNLRDIGNKNKIKIKNIINNNTKMDYDYYINKHHNQIITKYKSDNK